MAKVLSVEQMRAVERAADAGGLSYALMMENAGLAVAQVILERVPHPKGKRAVLLIGSGNNGGDGLVAGEHLAEAGMQVAAYLAAPREADDPHLARLRARGVLIATAAEDQRGRVLRSSVGTADLILDALLGTGFRLPLRGPVKDVLATARTVLEAAQRRPLVVAIDCPSGMDCDTGEIAPESLAADLTVTLAAAKLGHFRFPGAGAVGTLRIADIGVPTGLPEWAVVDLEVAEAAALAAWLPARPRDGHKGTFGRAVVVAGSVNFPGAAMLAGVSALRVGCGLVTLAVPSAIQGLIVPLLPEATWILLPHELGVLTESAADVLLEELGRAEAILFGPGFGQDPATGAFLARVLGAQQAAHRGRIGFVPAEKPAELVPQVPPCVVDADGLKLLTRIENWPRSLPPRSVLTPHPGEMSVLIGRSIDEIQADRVASARAAANAWGHVVVLKGAFTVVADPDGRAMILPFATSALAHGGTGDVLAGAIAGLRAQGLPPFEAAVLGAWLHARAGEIAAEDLGTEAGVLAGEVADGLPSAWAELEAIGAAGPSRSVPR